MAGRPNNAPDKTRELQIKLYQAAKRSPSRRFHALYDRIYRKDVMRRGWDEVRRRHGAPGVDGVTIESIEEQGVEGFLDELAVELQEGRYRPLPVRRVTIPKPDGGERNIGVPAVRDRVVQAAAYQVLMPIYEADFLDCSYGFRPKRSARDALEAVRTAANRGRSWVVDADIAGFFDAIGKEVLLDALRERISDRRVLKLLTGWLTAGVWTGEALLHPETGTPQGGVISPLMANVLLHRLDRVWQTRHRRLGVLVRYCDDLVILCPTKERADAALAALTAILADLGLALNQAKTRLLDLRNPGVGFDFLGFHHRWVESIVHPGRWFCARWPSDRAVRKARDAIRAHTARRWVSLPVTTIVTRLNRYLTGWLNYFRWGNSARVLHDLDYFAEQRLARFIAKKHGRKGIRYGQWVLYGNGNLGLQRLTGNVRYVTA